MTLRRAPVSARAAGSMLVATLLAVSALASLWLYPLHMAPAAGALIHPTLAPAAPWTVSKALFLFTMWSVMMAAMMIPSATPMAAAVERMARGGGNTRPLGAVAVFMLAYVVVWTGFSAIATAAQWAADRASLLSAMMASASVWFSGLTLIAAGAFQFSPLKHSCLSRCRSPIGFLLTAWRPGLSGAFFTGLRHGGYCVGCCWMLMALLFVFGTMNLVAAAGLAALVFAEKTFPRGAIIARIAGIGFMATGAYLLLELRL